MFPKWKRFILGDKRPVVRSVMHPVIGTLTYADDDEAWLTDPETSGYGFGFYISGYWDGDAPEIGPAPALVDHAAWIASHPEAFTQLVRDFIVSELQTVKSLAAQKDEVQQLRVYRVALMWPDRPDDGEIELRTSRSSDRMWHCGYVDRKPTSQLSFSGLDQ